MSAVVAGGGRLVGRETDLGEQAVDLPQTLLDLLAVKRGEVVEGDGEKVLHNLLAQGGLFGLLVMGWP